MEPLEDEAFVSSAWGVRHGTIGGEGYFILVHGKCLSVSKALHTIRKQQKHQQNHQKNNRAKHLTSVLVRLKTF